MGDLKSRIRKIERLASLVKTQTIESQTMIGMSKGDIALFREMHLDILALSNCSNYREPLVNRRWLAGDVGSLPGKDINFVSIHFPSQKDLQEPSNITDWKRRDETFPTDLARFGLVYDF